MRINRSGLFSLSLLAVLTLAACSGSNAQMPLADIQVSSEAQPASDQAANSGAAASAAGAAQQSGEYPPLVMGSPDFHETDPETVNLASGQVQFIEFFAYWCPNCKAMAPAVHGLEKIYGDRVNFVYLDRDKDSTAAIRNQLGYVYQPHFFILDGDGNILYQHSGTVPAEELQTQIEMALASSAQ